MVHLINLLMDYFYVLDFSFTAVNTRIHILKWFNILIWLIL